MTFPCYICYGAIYTCMFERSLTAQSLPPFPAELTIYLPQFFQTSNQRIERLWRDVFVNCTLSFYEFFYGLEDKNILDCDNTLHTAVLQWCFLPLYNGRLQSWRQGWNHHKLRTSNNRSPFQLWERPMRTDVPQRVKIKIKVTCFVAEYMCMYMNVLYSPSCRI